MKLSKGSFSILCIEILLLLAVFYIPHQFTTQACIIVADVFVLMTVYRILKNGFQDVPLFFFNITYCIFVLSGCTVSIFKTGSVADYISVGLNERQLTEACWIALLGIACLDIIYFLLEHTEKVESDNICIREPVKIQKQMVLLVFAIASICKMAMAYEKMTYSATFGYVALYTREVSILPGIVRYLGALFYFSLMLVLSAGFSKKTTYAVYGITGIIEAMILNSGDRGEAVCGILVLIIYTIFRCRSEPSFLIHKKIVIFALCVSLPLFVFALQLIKYTRVGNTADFSLWEGFFEFFESQGVSINIISNEIAHKNEITAIGGHTFVVKQILSYLQQNVLSRTILGLKKVAGNSVEMAMSGSSLGSTIMYIILPRSYLRGIGCGTCYLAELYQDASWFGIIFGTGIISGLLRWIKKMNRQNWIVSAMMLNCMRIVLVLPRGAFFKWMTEIFSVPNLMLLFVVCFIGSLMDRKKVER